MVAKMLSVPQIKLVRHDHYQTKLTHPQACTHNHRLTSIPQKHNAEDITTLLNHLATQKWQLFAEGGEKKSDQDQVRFPLFFDSFVHILRP